MRTRYDQLGKQMLRAALERRGPVETDAEVLAGGARRIDLWFVPDATRAGAADDFGLLGRITEGPSTLELFHDTPGGEELTACVLKHGEFRRVLALREAPPAMPTLWIISSGRPQRSIDGLGLRPMAGWPRGVYEAPPLLWTRLVIVNELPVTPERALALPVLLRLRLDIPRDLAKQTTDDQEFLMDTQDIVEIWRREAVQEGVREGRAEGVQRALIEIMEARFGAMATDVRAAIEGTHDDAVLRAWVKLAATRSAAETIAAIRAVHAG